MTRRVAFVYGLDAQTGTIFHERCRDSVFRQTYRQRLARGLPHHGCRCGNGPSIISSGTSTRKGASHVKHRTDCQTVCEELRRGRTWTSCFARHSEHVTVIRAYSAGWVPMGLASAYDLGHLTLNGP